MKKVVLLMIGLSHFPSQEQHVVILSISFWTRKLSFLCERCRRTTYPMKLSFISGLILEVSNVLSRHEKMMIESMYESLVSMPPALKGKENAVDFASIILDSWV